LALARVIVVGSYNTDLAVTAPRFPAPGETLLGGSLRIGPGGKGSNQAIAAARLGAEVSFVGRLGRDPFGEEARKTLAREGVDSSCVVADGEAPTGAAIILVSESGENEIVVAPGANLNLSPEDVDAAASLFTKGSVLLTQLEVSPAATARAAELARAAGAFSILNPAPATRETIRLLPLFDLLTPNATEAGIIAGTAVETEEAAKETGRRLLERGARVVLITLGRRGSVLVSPEREIHIPAFPVEARDTTGAGDAFNGALAFALARGEALDTALTFASAAAALSVTRPGTADSMPTLAEVEEFVARSG
jgi:ribokinase